MGRTKKDNTYKQTIMAVAFSKPEVIYHNSLPMVMNPNQITFDYVSQNEEGIQVDIPGTYTEEENEVLMEIFQKLWEEFSDGAPQSWTILEKYKVFVDCSVKLLNLMK